MPVPYNAVCIKCKSTVFIEERWMDEVGDVRISIYPCGYCLERAKKKRKRRRRKYK